MTKRPDAFRYIVTGVVAAVMIAGVASAAPRAERSAAQAQAALAKGDANKAVQYAEQVAQR